MMRTIAHILAVAAAVAGMCLAAAPADANARSAGQTNGPHAGRVSGRVTTAAGHPLAGVCVLALTTYDFTPRLGRRTARTSANGTYAIRLRPGRYYIDFLPTCTRHGNYAPQLWKSADSLGQAEAVHVIAAHTKAGINARLRAGARVTGRIRTQVKGPHPSLGGVCVTAFGKFGQLPFESRTVTAKNGSYSLGSLSTGDYRVIVSWDCAKSPVWIPSSRLRPVEVTDGTVSRAKTIWVKLAGTITGVVKDTSGTRLSGVCVEADAQNASSEAVTRANGTYRMPGLAAGRYRISSDPDCRTNEPYGWVKLPGLVRVRAGAATRDVDLTLPFDGGMSGVVQNARGEPLSGICVIANGTRFGSGSVVTKADGRYTMKKLSPGKYRVRFSSGCGRTGYATRWYRNARTKAGAQVVLVGAATVTTGIDARLPRR